jgi:hypothetical protein
MDSKLPAWLLRDQPARSAAGYAKPWSADKRKVPAWMRKPIPRRKAAAIAAEKSSRKAMTADAVRPEEWPGVNSAAELVVYAAIWAFIALVAWLVFLLYPR